MNISQLKEVAAHQQDVRIHVIRSLASKLYQIECEAETGHSVPLEERGRPQLFRSLEDVYDVLKQVGVQHAWLVRWEQRHPTASKGACLPPKSGLIQVAL
ncbi:DUF6482 family protein [Zymobacter palmae]|uniref:NADH:ubiquinone oxidoreductase subunit 4 n=1 Tax=Zymobacter palmae TaxID=33074 RepID=A0A348HGT7_9GAMM|nr:DUF6482 family protein [Zymobacter palmae]BBG30839.1 NADH:ubiquinone oxidoreductase subunit 4 [Zymobacter palmae]